MSTLLIITGQDYIHVTMGSKFTVNVVVGKTTTKRVSFNLTHLYTYRLMHCFFFSFRDYNWFWVPIAGPLVGSIIGSLVYILMIKHHWPKDDERPEVLTLKVNGHDNKGYVTDSEKL